MALTFKSIGKKLTKAVKKGARFVAKALPVVAALTPVGGIVGKLATGALKATSKLKSKGVDLKKAAIATPSVSTAIAVQKAIKGTKEPAAATRKSTPAPPKPKKATKPKKPSQATLLALYDEWLASDQELPWSDYAQLRLNQ